MPEDRRRLAIVGLTSVFVTSVKKCVPTDISTHQNVWFRTFFPTSALSESGIRVCILRYTLSPALGAPLSVHALVYYNFHALSSPYSKISASAGEAPVSALLTSSGCEVPAYSVKRVPTTARTPFSSTVSNAEQGTAISISLLSPLAR